MIISLLSLVVVIQSQFNFNRDFGKLFPEKYYDRCPQNHTLVWGLYPHSCVSYLPECLGVTQVELKIVNKQQILCHPNYQVNLTKDAIIKYGFYVDPVMSITVQQVNSSMLKFTTEIQMNNCAIIYVYQLKGQPKNRCLYYKGWVDREGYMFSKDSIQYSYNSPLNITPCINQGCLGCYPNGIQCYECKNETFLSGIYSYDCYESCQPYKSNAWCARSYEPRFCIEGFYRVFYSDTFYCAPCPNSAETCDQYGNFTKCGSKSDGNFYYPKFYVNGNCVMSQYCYDYDVQKSRCMSCMPMSNVTINSQVCQLCGIGCFLCDSSSKCNIYKPFYYYNETSKTLATRKNCSLVCQTCFIDNPSKCTTCNNNFQLNNFNQCVCEQERQLYEIDGYCLHCTEGICNICITYTQCLACKPETFRYLEETKCLCQDGYYDDQSPDYICKKCHNTCKTCTGGEVSNCISCDSSLHRKLIKGQCVCEFGLGDNKDDPEDIFCRQCHETCQSCDFQFDSKSCTTCFSSQFRQLAENSECVCIDNYADNQGVLLECYTCHFSCGTCIGGLENDCIYCLESSHRVLQLDGKCLCTKGYFESDSQSTICQSCHYSCLDCFANPENNKCTECPSSRQPDGNESTFSCICKDEHYFDDGINQECQQCHYSCIFCSFFGPKFCLSCDLSVRKLQYGVCSCLGRAYDDGISSCKECFQNCLTCLGPEQTDCLTCSTDIDFRELMGGACVCLEGYFEENGSLICSKCSYRCKTCQISQDQCLTCPENTFRKLGDDFSCSCQSGFYDNINTIKCLVCHFKCLTCSGLKENQCSTCKPLANRIFKDNQCLCLPHYFEENVEQCSICSQQCYECVDTYDKCTSCESGRTLVGTTCECNTKLNGLLISTYGLVGSVKCDDCHYSCLQCQGRNFNQCLSCVELEFRYLDASTSTCQCNPGYFDIGTQVCKKCGYQCENCINTENQCLSCQQNSLRILNAQSRLCQCSSGYFDDGSNSICQKCAYSCVQCSLKPNHCLTCLIDSYRQFNEVLNKCDCIQGYFDSGQPVCQPCHYSCFECFGLSNVECKSCVTSNNKSKRIQENTQCLCQDGYYDNGSSSDCQVCDVLCKNCQSQSYFCTSCSTTRILSINICKCKQGYFEIGQNECQKCDSNCLECNTNSKICTVCDETLSRVLDLSTKFCVCKSNYLELNGICVMCNRSCQTCSSTIDTCSNCSEDRILFNNKCICGEGYYNQQENCLLCHKSCLSCKDSEQFCLTCSVENYRQLQDNKCPCIDGYYESSSTLSCEKCDKSCKTCAQDSNNCTSCDSFLNYDIINNKCLCKQGYYLDLNTILCSTCLISCKTCDQYTKCTSCQVETRIYNGLAFTCECKLGYFEINQQGCQRCHYQCETCSGDEKNCLTCNTQVHRSLLNHKCECETGYFDAGIDICLPCGIRCKTCVGQANKCTECYETEQFRKLNVNSCDCLNGYFDQGLDFCLKCSIKCKTCKNFDDYCTSCDIDQKRIDLSIFHKCPCIQGFYEDGNGECQKCHIKCESCIQKRDKCLVCNDPTKNNRYLLSNQCNCKPGFYDDDIQLECQKCNKICKTCTLTSLHCSECVNNLRINPPLCTCQDGYYEDETQSCMKCQNQCLTCITSESNCTTCKPGRININCECEPGYFEAGFEECQKCSFMCLQCSLQSVNCTICKGDRKNPPFCICEDGYFDNGLNEKCQTCDFRCQTCDILGCLSCNGNRILTNEQTCDPPVGSASYETTPWCSNCEVAVLDIRFSDDLSSLIIKFDFQLKSQKSITTCSSFIDDMTLTQLGFGFNCKIDGQDNRNLIIILGVEPKVLIGGSILIKEDSLQHLYCVKKIKKFIFNTIKGPENILEPKISFNVPNEYLSGCVENIIYQNFTICDGNRQFTLINWSYKILEKDNTQELDDFINKLNLNQELNLVIPAKTLPESSTIAFYLKVQNFIGTQAISSFEINTQSDSQPIIQVDLKKKYYVYQEIEMPFQVQIVSCRNQTSSQTQSLFQIELSEISRSNPQAKSSNMNFQVQSSETNYSITIPKYSLSPQTIYDFSLKVNEINKQLSSVKEFSLEISPAKLLCQFENAVNIQNFRNELVINLICKDLNTNQDWNQDFELNIEIICIDLSTNDICLNQQKKPIEIIQNSYKQTLPKYSVKPFTAQSWQVVATKGNLKNAYEQIIVFLDEDFTPLEVNHSLAYITRNINNQELLDFTIQIPFEKQKNVVEISLGIIVDFEVLQLLQLQYIQHSIVLQDYINLNQQHQNNKYNLKFAVQYSTSINPSFYNLPLTLNVPPICPSFKQVENNYQGLTEIEIIVNCAQAEDSPYEYRLGYILSDEEMQGYLNRSRGEILGLQQFQRSPNLNMILPNFFKNNPIKFIIFVMDQGGSITNLYGQTTVEKQFDCQSDQILDQAQKNLSLEIAFMIQAIGQEEIQCQDLAKKLYQDLLSKTNLQNEDKTFWLKAIKIYKTYSNSFQTRILKAVKNSTCYNEEKNNFLVNSSEVNQKKQTKNYGQLENDFQKFKSIVRDLKIHYISLKQQLKDLTIDWNQNLYEQFEEAITSLQLSFVLADDIFVDAFTINENETRLLVFFEQIIAQIDQISMLVSDKALINGKSLMFQGKAFNWKLQRLTRKMLNQQLRRESIFEDEFVSYSQNEQFELNYNPYQFEQNISHYIESEFNFTKFMIDSNKMIRPKLSNVNLHGQLIYQKQLETRFSIEMYETGLCQNVTESQLTSEDFSAQCFQLSEEKQIQKCNISILSRQQNDQISLNCICSTFGDTFIVYYQDQSQNISMVDVLSTDNILNKSFNFDYGSVFVISTISYVAVVLIIFCLCFMKKATLQRTNQETLDSNDNDKFKQQILCYPGNLTIIKENFKYLHSLSQFCYQTPSKISNSFIFIDLNNQFGSMILVILMIKFYLTELSIFIEIALLILIGFVYRAFSKLLQGFFRLHKFFEILIYILQVILFLSYSFFIAILISSLSKRSDIEKVTSIVITGFVQFFIDEVVLVTLSILIYSMVYQSIKHKEFNIIYHLLYFFAYHERLEMIFEQYLII